MTCLAPLFSSREHPALSHGYRFPPPLLLSISTPLPFSRARASATSASSFVCSCFPRWYTAKPTMLIEYPTTCTAVMALPNSATLTRMTHVFFTCPMTLNVRDEVDLITARVSRFTKNPKNAAHAYLCGAFKIFPNPFSSTSARHSKHAMPRTKNPKLAGAMTYKPSMSSKRKLPSKYCSTAIRHASENSDANIMTTPIHWNAISPYAASAVPKVRIATPRTVTRCGFSRFAPTNTIIVTHGTAALSIWMNETDKYKYV
mmetsp:Transcript_6510/g.27749  ORF Transcript_6510/g.27749 Transcript_6510/m.27749 type:complete len:259 (-) Transcript_6510:337-1113(-)